jgi:hypothetical protein
MAKSERELISEQRKLLENPYAHIEQLVAPEQGPPITVSTLAASRKLLENLTPILPETADTTSTERATASGQGGLVGLMNRSSSKSGNFICACGANERRFGLAQYPRTLSSCWTQASHYAWSDSTSRSKTASV